MSPPQIRGGPLKTKHMAKTKDVKETARLTIICNSNEECSVKTKGDMTTMTAALACLLDTDDENNQFRNMMSLAIQVVIAEKENKKKPAKKKAVVKKNNPKQMNSVKSTEPFVKTRKKAAKKK